MAYTIQQVLDLARGPLADAKKRRYTDAQLLSYFNSAVMRAHELRPDLRFGSYGTDFAPVAIGQVGQAFPMPDRYAQTVADYIGGRAEMHDDEAVNGNRAQTLMALFVSELTQ